MTEFAEGFIKCGHCGGPIYDPMGERTDPAQPRHRDCRRQTPEEAAEAQAAAEQLTKWQIHLGGLLVRRLAASLQGDRLNLLVLHPTHNPSGYQDSFDEAVLEVENDGEFRMILQDYTTGVKVRVRLQVEDVE